MCQRAGRISRRCRRCMPRISRSRGVRRGPPSGAGRVRPALQRLAEGGAEAAGSIAGLHRRGAADCARAPLSAPGAERPEDHPVCGHWPTLGLGAHGGTEVAINLRHSAAPETPMDERLAAGLSAQGPGPELALLKSQYREAFQQSFRAALGTLTDQESTILRLHFVSGLSLDRLGEMYQVHRATIARWVARAREQLLKSTQSELHARLTVDATRAASDPRAGAQPVGHHPHPSAPLAPSRPSPFTARRGELPTRGLASRRWPGRPTRSPGPPRGRRRSRASLASPRSGRLRPTRPCGATGVTRL